LLPARALAAFFLKSFRELTRWARDACGTFVGGSGGDTAVAVLPGWLPTWLGLDE